MYCSELSDMAAFIIAHPDIDNSTDAYNLYVASSSGQKDEISEPEVRFRKFILTKKLPKDILKSILFGG